MNTKQERIRKGNLPERYFSGKDLEMGQAIYKEDRMTIEKLIKVEHFNVNGRGYKKLEGKMESHDYPDPNRFTYLGYAVLIGATDAARKLLDLGANINLVSIDAADALCSNINMACDNRNKKMVLLLLQYHVNLNPPLCGSPVEVLLYGDADRDLIDLLLKNGADINYQAYGDGDMAILTAFEIGKLDYVNYFLDKGANPTILDYFGNSFALLLQEAIWEARMDDSGLKECNKIKDRLISQYHIKFPVKKEMRIGIKMGIERYENLSQADKDLLGENEKERIQELRDSLAKGATITGLSIDSIEDASMQPPTNYKE